ncbi:hypothetical protein D3C72_2235150 [compost metagenome]
MLFLGSIQEHTALLPINHYPQAQYVLDYATDVSDNNGAIDVGSCSHKTHQNLYY